MDQAPNRTDLDPQDNLVTINPSHSGRSRMVLFTQPAIRHSQPTQYYRSFPQPQPQTETQQIAASATDLHTQHLKFTPSTTFHASSGAFLTHQITTAPSVPCIPAQSAWAVPQWTKHKIEVTNPINIFLSSYTTPAPNPSYPSHHAITKSNVTSRSTLRSPTNAQHCLSAVMHQPKPAVCLTATRTHPPKQKQIKTKTAKATTLPKKKSRRAKPPAH